MEKPKQAQHPFLSDVQTLRQRAMEHMEQGAVTPGYQADRKTVIKLLNEALATELVCTLRYKNHYLTAQGLESKAVADEFAEHAREEEEHAERIARRIHQLGGDPDFSPEGLMTRSHSEYQEGDSLIMLIEEDLYAERIAIESYSQMIRFIGDSDSTTRVMMEGILAKEEEHAEEMCSLLKHVGRGVLHKIR